MLKQDSDGLYYVSETTNRRYELAYGHSFCADKTDDICYILYSGFTEEEYKAWLNDEFERTDDNVETFVGFFYGASFVEGDLEETNRIIKGYVDEFERK